MSENNLGLVHLYYGNGKGKTTSSIGLSVRAAGFGLNVLFSQFLKSGSSSELNSFEKLDNIKVIRIQKKFPFTNKMTDEQIKEITEIHNKIFTDVLECIATSKYDLLVFDELLTAYNGDFIDKKIVEDFFSNKPKNLEIVITGHEINDKFLSFADYVSEIKKIKHPYDNGMQARKGIEF